MFGIGNPATSFLVLFSLVLSRVQEERSFIRLRAKLFTSAQLYNNKQFDVDISLKASPGPGITGCVFFLARTNGFNSITA